MALFHTKDRLRATVNAKVSSDCDDSSKTGAESSGVSVFALSTRCEFCTTYFAPSYFMRCNEIESMIICASDETWLLKKSYTISLTTNSSRPSTLSLEPVAILTIILPALSVI